MVNMAAGGCWGLQQLQDMPQLLATPCNARVQVGSRGMPEGVAVAIRCLPHCHFPHTQVLPLNFITGCPAVTQSKFGLVQRKINCLVELLWPFIKGRGVFRFFSLLCYMEMRSRKNTMKSGKIEVGWSPKGSTAVTGFGQWSITELYTQIMVVSSNSQIVRSIWIWCVSGGNNHSPLAALHVSSENVTDS